MQKSATHPSKPKAEFTGFSTEIGSKFFGINASANFMIPKNIRIQRNSNSYDQMLSFSSNIPVILYDTSDQRAWMVPALGVIYHMVHVWFSQHRDSFTTTINQPPYARAVANIGREAREVISDHGEFSLYHSVEDRKPRFLREHVKNYLLQFEQMMAAPPVHDSLGTEKLRGWDLMEIVWGQPLSSLSTPTRAKFQGNWYSLIRNSNMIVLFCHGLGDVIVPEFESQKVCKAWKAVPLGKDYLTATVRCLKMCSSHFPDSRGFSKLMAKRHRRPGELDAIFADCSHGDKAKCHRAQHLWKRDEVSKFEDLQIEGAVIFGNQD
ncbi:hypothetical protein GP486_005996 [Trichoglossum hirsutum]|uniref:Uncharacterized protein n=1 Tax=Trichoglossum hirsutum TaxID=265104 RepID=A0A9P8L880_9PEZI|nr:hypothetical protein GP486_005996 [Trichoglossum hirsutum]